MTLQAFGALILRLMVQYALFAGVTLWWLRQKGRTWKSIGFARPTRRQIVFAIVGGVAVAVAGYWLAGVEIRLLRFLVSPVVFQRLQGFTDAYGAEHLFVHLPEGWMRLAFALIGSLLAPVCEEMLFRGLLIHALQERLRLRIGGAIVVSALLFALAHGSPLRLLPLLLMGIAFGSAYVRTGSLWVPIGMHVVNNAVNFALLTLVWQ